MPLNKNVTIDKINTYSNKNGNGSEFEKQTKPQSNAQSKLCKLGKCSARGAFLKFNNGIQKTILFFSPSRNSSLLLSLVTHDFLLRKYFLFNFRLNLLILNDLIKLI